MEQTFISLIRCGLMTTIILIRKDLGSNFVLFGSAYVVLAFSRARPGGLNLGKRLDFYALTCVVLSF